MDTTQHAPAIAPTISSDSARLAGIVPALALGLSIVFGVGFLQGPGNAVHNAAHDTRHAFAFPCH